MRHQNIGELHQTCDLERFECINHTLILYLCHHSLGRTLLDLPIDDSQHNYPWLSMGKNIDSTPRLAEIRAYLALRTACEQLFGAYRRIFWIRYRRTKDGMATLSQVWPVKCSCTHLAGQEGARPLCVHFRCQSALSSLLRQMGI
jgi:hypothetical protein